MGMYMSLDDKITCFFLNEFEGKIMKQEFWRKNSIMIFEMKSCFKYMCVICKMIHICIYRVFQSSTNKLRTVEVSINRLKNNMEHRITNHPFNRKYRVFYPNQTLVDVSNFQKAELHYNKIFNSHAHFFRNIKTKN